MIQTYVRGIIFSSVFFQSVFFLQKGYSVHIFVGWVIQRNTIIGKMPDFYQDIQNLKIGCGAKNIFRYPTLKKRSSDKEAFRK